MSGLFKPLKVIDAFVDLYRAVPGMAGAEFTAIVNADVNELPWTFISVVDGMTPKRRDAFNYLEIEMRLAGQTVYEFVEDPGDRDREVLRRAFHLCQTIHEAIIPTSAPRTLGGLTKNISFEEMIPQVIVGEKGQRGLLRMDWTILFGMPVTQLDA